MSFHKRAHKALSFALGLCGLLGLGGVGCTNQVVDEGDGVAAAGLVPEGATDQALTRECATVNNPIKGIDVSRYQGNIDWDRVKGDGVEFAFIRVSDGLSHVDSKFDRNWAESKRVGVRRGAYQFFRPNLSAAAQASLFLEKMGTLEPGDLPPVIDIEANGGLSPSQVASRSKEWIDIVEAATGVKPIIYSSGYFFRDKVGSPSWARDYMLWVAHYTTGCALTPQPWSMWSFHQYTDSGTVAGISGGVDTNRFNGSLADLDAITVGGTGSGNACENLGADGGILDEENSCARLAGPTNFLRSVSDENATNGSYIWTGTTASENVYNYGIWTLGFDVAGTYDIAANIPAGAGTSESATYRISGTTEMSRVVNQSTSTGFVELARVTVNAGDRVTVRLNDNTGEAGSLSRRVAFDSIRVLAAGGISEPDPTPSAEPDSEPDSEPDDTNWVDCGDVDGLSTVVSEDASCVDLGGPSQYLRSDTGGHGGSHVWTYATSNSTATNFARFNLNFDTSARYLVEAHIPAGTASSIATNYVVKAALGNERVVVNQANNRDWVGVGIFDFVDGIPAFVEVQDNSGEPAGTSKKIVFDAIRLTPAAALTCTAATVTATALNVRPTPGTSQSAVGQITSGDVVDAMEQVSGQMVSGNAMWVRVRKGPMTGWVSTTFVDCAPSSNPGPDVEPDASEPDASEPDASEPDASEPDASEPDAGPISSVDHAFVINRLSGNDVDPFNYPESRQGFQEYLTAVGVTFFSADEYVTPNNATVAANCGYSELLPPRTMWRNAGALGLLADEVRTSVGAAITLRNWWRPACYNSGVGGAAGGDHPDGDALDLDFSSARSRADGQRYLCQNYWNADFLSTSEIVPGSGLSKKLNMSIGLGGVSIHLGVLSDRGRRFWKYSSYTAQSNSGGCW